MLCRLFRKFSGGISSWRSRGTARIGGQGPASTACSLRAPRPNVSPSTTRGWRTIDVLGRGARHHGTTTERRVCRPLPPAERADQSERPRYRKAVRAGEEGDGFYHPPPRRGGRSPARSRARRQGQPFLRASDSNRRANHGWMRRTSETIRPLGRVRSTGYPAYTSRLSNRWSSGGLIDTSSWDGLRA